MPNETAADLRAAGLRVTEPRVAVLEAVRRRPHAPASDVVEQVRSSSPGVSVQTVYNCLAVLTEAGIVRRIELPGVPGARYEHRRGDNHHHLVCRKCGALEDVACAQGHAPCLAAAEDHGYEIDEAEVIYRGLCPTCRANP